MTRNNLDGRMMKKDKQKVLDEVWTEELVKSFLAVRSHDGTDEDFHMLL